MTLMRAERLHTVSVTTSALLLFATGARAIPTQLTVGEFGAQIGGAPTQVEDFESASTGNQGNPYTFLNGTYSTGGGGFASVTNSWRNREREERIVGAVINHCR